MPLVFERDPAEKQHGAARMRCVGYARVSTDRQAERGFGLAVQEQKIKAWAEAHGYELCEVLRDDGVSGTNDLADRSGLADALALLREKRAGALVVYRAGGAVAGMDSGGGSGGIGEGGGANFRSLSIRSASASHARASLFSRKLRRR